MRIFLYFIFLSVLYPQIENPVSVSYITNNAVRSGEALNIMLKAEMDDPNWRIYSVHKRYNQYDKRKLVTRKLFSLK